MKIAIVSPYPIGRVLPNIEKNYRPVTWTENLANELAKINNIELHIVAGVSPRLRNTKNYFKKNNIHFHFFKTSGRFSPYMFYLYEVIKVRSILKIINPEIVHGQGFEGHSGLAAILSGYPNIVTVHGVLNEIHGENYWDNFILKLLEKISVKLAKNIIAITPYTKNLIKKYDPKGFKKKKIFDIQNAVAEEFYKCSPKLGNSINILYCGVFTPRKGLIDLLYALKLLEIKAYSFTLHIVGIFNKNLDTQIYFDKVKKYIQNNFKNNVIIHGFIEPSQTPNIFKNMDILVLPSKVESFSMATAEAMAIGIPVIAYDVDGPKYLIDDGITGFLVRLNDINELSDKIEILLKNSDLRISMGRNARIKAQKMFHPQIVVKKTLESYFEVTS
jgi:glycosyltransferase involved in cell wall biosynthesis